MFLRRLDLVGFKSFAAKTVTELQPGIVVVVGPNGSGKSNIADAVLWVLGEQSAKAVRARKPEEVIFAGSAARQPLGMAEVSLILDNSDGSLPIEFDEVRVTRRLYRSGDSEYLLNGARVRLKDITQLLLHAGLSPDSYSVIGQGSIDELILQRPDERRVAFENVADIRRHQLRLNDTRSKLTTTEANLVRVQDVLAELTPHVKRLKGQAERASRADGFRAELHTLLVRFFRARLSQAHAARRHAETDLLEATAGAEEADAATVTAEHALRATDAQLATLDERVAVLRPRAEAFREQARVAERSLAVARERLAGLADQHATIEAEIARLRGTLGRLTVEEQEAARAAGHSASDPAEGPVGDDLERARAELARQAEAYAALEQARDDAQAAVDAAAARVADAEARLARTEQHLHALGATVAVEEARQSERAARLATLADQATAVQAEVADVRQRAEEARARLAAAASASTAAGDELERAREKLRAASQQADRLQGALAALGAETLDAGDDADLAPEWQAALEGLPVRGRARDLAARIRPIDQLLGGYLQRIVVLATDEAAREAHRRLSARLAKDSAAWAVLSMDGLLIAAPGEHPLEAVADDSGSALADWSRQVRQLETERAEAEAQRRSALGAVQAARDGLDDAEAGERGARMALGEFDARLAELNRSAAALENERRQFEIDLERIARGATQRAQERDRSTSRVGTIRAELNAARAERDRLVAVLTAADERRNAARQTLDEARTAVMALEAAADRREVERAAREALHARIQGELAATETAHENAAARRTQLSLQQVQLAERQAQLEAELEAMAAELAPVERELHEVEQARTTWMAERQTLEQRLGVLRAAERAAHEAREARHVAAQRAADEVDRLNTEIAETAELEAELTGGANWAEQLRLGLDGGDETATSARETFDVEAARRRIASLQRELRSVGGVAESVVAEYRELSERHAFLEQQSADLRAAMAELRSAAEELESHMRDRFAEAFEAIQAAFQECFVGLFGGGEARLVLTEPDDLLRTGIDIVARPPGKKLQGLLSLSGGERALTVVSLLFGLLKINPTPFCVLDEVDAALDEANVQRFANLLADFARQIQFIVVTHNRATMDKADAMYGVSMDGQGISHVFSVRPRAVAAASEEYQASAIG